MGDTEYESLDPELLRAYMGDGRQMQYADNLIRVSLATDVAGANGVQRRNAVADEIHRQLKRNNVEGMYGVQWGGSIEDRLDAIGWGDGSKIVGGKIDGKKIKKTINDIATIGTYVPHPAVSVPASIVKALTGGKLTLAELQRMNALPNVKYEKMSYTPKLEDQQQRIDRINNVYKNRVKEADIIKKPMVGAGSVGGMCGGCADCRASRNSVASQVQNMYETRTRKNLKNR